MKKNNKRPRPEDKTFDIPGLDPEIDPAEVLMFGLAEMGVTPEQYREFLVYYQEISGLKEQYLSGDVNDDDSAPDNLLPFDIDPVFRPLEKLKDPLPDAKDKTLILKIQMEGVTHPPMWRQLSVPADMSFGDLHLAIQAATQLEDFHLWQFQRRPYDHGMSIADTEMVADATYEADDLSLTRLLREKGDKLCYIYDFGDDWIFNVEVKEIVDRDGDCCVCTKWKSDLQPIEDCGGIYFYSQMREILANPPKTKKEKERFAESLGYEGYDMLIDHLQASLIDIEFVNECLADIPFVE